MTAQVSHAIEYSGGTGYHAATPDTLQRRSSKLWPVITIGKTISFRSDRRAYSAVFKDDVPVDITSHGGEPHPSPRVLPKGCADPDAWEIRVSICPTSHTDSLAR